MGVPRHFKEHVFVSAFDREKSAASRDGFGEGQPCSVDAADLPLNARHVGMLALPTIDHQGDQFLRRRDGDGKTAALVLANDTVDVLTRRVPLRLSTEARAETVQILPQSPQQRPRGSGRHAWSVPGSRNLYKPNLSVSPDQAAPI